MSMPSLIAESLSSTTQTAFHKRLARRPLLLKSVPCLPGLAVPMVLSTMVNDRWVTGVVVVVV